MQLWSPPLVVRMSEPDSQDGRPDHPHQSDSSAHERKVGSANGHGHTHACSVSLKDGQPPPTEGRPDHSDKGSNNPQNDNGNNSAWQRGQQVSVSQTRDHEKFVAALEAHGDWNAMARELGWRVDDVQTYAFRYMAALQEEDDIDSSELGESDRNGNTHNPVASGATSSQDTKVGAKPPQSPPWSLEESVMFENLVALYHPASAAVSGDAGEQQSVGDYRGSWEHLIAAHLPERTASQVRQRYRDIYLRRKVTGQET